MDNLGTLVLHMFVAMADLEPAAWNLDAVSHSRVEGTGGCECRVFYLVTYIWQMGVYILFMVVFAVFGSAIGLKMFTKNSWGVQVCYPR